MSSLNEIIKIRMILEKEVIPALNNIETFLDEINNPTNQKDLLFKELDQIER